MDDHRPVGDWRFLVGRGCFVAATAAFGALHLFRALSLELPGQGPPWKPLPGPLLFAIAAALILGAIATALRRSQRIGAIVVGVVYLLVAAPYLAAIVADPSKPGPWTSGGELLSLAGAAGVLAGGSRPARWLFALPLLVFGVQHFQYAEFVATLVPAWIPAALFLTYLVGVGFIAAGVSIVLNVLAQLAATLLGLVFFVFVVTTHVPRVASATGDSNEWTSLLIALAMAGASWLVGASTHRGVILDATTFRPREPARSAAVAPPR